MQVTEIHEEKNTFQVDVNIPGHYARGAASALFMHSAGAEIHGRGLKVLGHRSHPPRAGGLMDERREKILGMTEVQFRVFVDDQLRAGSVQFQAHQQMLEQNTALTQQTANNTSEMVELFSASKRGFRFFQGFGNFLNRAARWATPILMAGGALWAIFHGHPPKGGGE
jgi:hypothetical protein